MSPRGAVIAKLSDLSVPKARAFRSAHFVVLQSASVDLFATRVSLGGLARRDRGGERRSPDDAGPCRCDGVANSDAWQVLMAWQVLTAWQVLMSVRDDPRSQIPARSGSGTCATTKTGIAGRGSARVFARSPRTVRGRTASEIGFIVMVRRIFITRRGFDVAGQTPGWDENNGDRSLHPHPALNFGTC